MIYSTANDQHWCTSQPCKFPDMLVGTGLAGQKIFHFTSTNRQDHTHSVLPISGVEVCILLWYETLQIYDRNPGGNQVS